jgi:Zn finger protein HypA/HybF involved in hydrogenase expression
MDVDRANTGAEARKEISEREPMLFCPVCSLRLRERKCKLFCEQCGYFMSCADYY